MPSTGCQQRGKLSLKTLLPIPSFPVAFPTVWTDQRTVIPTDVDEESEGEEGLDGDEEVDGLGEMENEEEDGRTETGGMETEGMEAGGTEADGRKADGMAASREEAEESEN